MAQLLENLSVAGSALVVTKGTDTQVVLAASNLKKIWTLPVEHLNALELLSRDVVIMTVEAARWVEESLANEPHGRRGAKWAASATATEDAPAAEVVETTESEAAAEPVAEEAAPRPRRRATAATTETETSDAAIESPAEKEAPEPRTRRRRTSAATTETETPKAAAETSAEEEAPKPRTRRRRTTASTADEPAPEAEVAETPDAKTPEEEA